jgi:hypothetical protein
MEAGIWLAELLNDGCAEHGLGECEEDDFLNRP